MDRWHPRTQSQLRAGIRRWSYSCKATRPRRDWWGNRQLFYRQPITWWVIIRHFWERQQNTNCGRPSLLRYWAWWAGNVEPQRLRHSLRGRPWNLSQAYPRNNWHWNVFADGAKRSVQFSRRGVVSCTRLWIEVWENHVHHWTRLRSSWGLGTRLAFDERLPIRPATRGLLGLNRERLMLHWHRGLDYKRHGRYLSRRWHLPAPLLLGL